MNKLNDFDKNTVISVLKNLISQLNESDQGYHLYLGTIEIIQSKDITKKEAFDIYRNYCGYLAYGEFSDIEYQQVKLIADYFSQISQ